MRLAEWISNFTASPVLMERMMARFGVRERLRQRPASAEVTRRAALRCSSCGDKRACSEWLDGTPMEESPVPAFCRNAGLIERLRRETA